MLWGPPPAATMVGQSRDGLDTTASSPWVYGSGKTIRRCPRLVRSANSPARPLYAAEHSRQFRERRTLPCRISLICGRFPSLAPPSCSKCMIHQQRRKTQGVTVLGLSAQDKAQQYDSRDDANGSTKRPQIRTEGAFRRSPPAHFHSPPIIRAAFRRRRRWVRRALADTPPRRSHPPSATSPTALRSVSAAQAPACRARMNSGT